MRKIVLEALKEKIQTVMEKRYPHFEFFSKSMRGDEKGLLRYKWQVNKLLACYIVFKPLTSEGFEISVGWSTKGRCPLSVRGIRRDEDFYNYNLDEMMVPLVVLSNRKGLSHWAFWTPSDDLLDNPEKYGEAYALHYCIALTKQQALELVDGAVGKGLSELAEFGLPYLKKKAEFLGKP